MNSKLLRWAALIMMLVNILYNRIIAGGSIMSDITDKYDPVFVPANYAFMIWSVIYLFFIIFLVYELLPKQVDQRRYDQLAITTIITSLLSICWITAFVNEYITLSLVIIIAMLITSLVLFYQAYSILPDERHNWILLVPFSLYAAWLSVATIANSAILLTANNWYGEGPSQEMWSIVMVMAAGLFGIFIGLKFRNIVFPLVIAWAGVAIWSNRHFSYPEFASVSMVCAIIMITLIFYILVKNSTHMKI
ncbi:MAG: tryptophan-rich sensory protein [Bacteroidota bacterium]